MFTSPELTISNGIIFKDVRMIVPKSLHGDMKQILYIGHLGVVKIKIGAHEIIYWPDINGTL